MPPGFSVAGPACPRCPKALSAGPCVSTGGEGGSPLLAVPASGAPSDRAPSWVLPARGASGSTVDSARLPLENRRGRLPPAGVVPRRGSSSSQTPSVVSLAARPCAGSGGQHQLPDGRVFSAGGHVGTDPARVPACLGHEGLRYNPDRRPKKSSLQRGRFLKIHRRYMFTVESIATHKEKQGIVGGLLCQPRREDPHVNINRAANSPSAPCTPGVARRVAPSGPSIACPSGHVSPAV